MFRGLPTEKSTIQAKLQAAEEGLWNASKESPPQGSDISPTSGIERDTVWQVVCLNVQSANALLAGHIFLCE